MDFAEHLSRASRLVILRALAGETSRTHNEAILQAALELAGIARSREYARTQLRLLADVGAIALREAGGVMIATLARPGLDHVEGRAVLDGVDRPELGG